MNSCKMKFICIALACFKNGFSLLVATHYYIVDAKIGKLIYIY